MLPIVGADPEPDAVPEIGKEVVWDGCCGHSASSKVFPQVRKNLMSHGKIGGGSQRERSGWSPGEGYPRRSGLGVVSK